MRKRNRTTASKAKRPDPPAELDFRKARFVGFGLDALKRYEAERSRTIVLDEDVAKVFQDPQAVNSLLRAIIEASGSTNRNRRRKSA